MEKSLRLTVTKRFCQIVFGQRSDFELQAF